MTTLNKVCDQQVKTTEEVRLMEKDPAIISSEVQRPTNAK